MIVEACARNVRALWVYPGAEAARPERHAALNDEAAEGASFFCAQCRWGCWWRAHREAS